MYDAHRTSGESFPLWLEDAGAGEGPTGLPRVADVVVVGAGMAGLSTAYHLLRAGRSVVVLDKGSIGSGETARTTAHLASALDDRFYVLERVHGPEGARLAAQSHAAAIDSIERAVRDERIACGFQRVDGYLFAGKGDSIDTLRREFSAARRAGLDVAWLDRAPLPFDTGPCLRFADQAQVEPIAYLQGLAETVRRLGGQICTGQHVERLTEGHPAIVHVQGGERVQCGAVVFATNTPINDTFAVHTKQAPYRTYVIGMQVAPGSVPRGLFWDTEDPYHYVRLAGDDLLLVGGEDHKVGQATRPEEHWQTLEAWTRERFPQGGPVRYRWSGQVQEPADGLAFIGRNPGRETNIFIATGDSGNGMTHGALAGMLLRDLICERENPWAALYAPSRKVSLTHLSAAREFLRENVNVARHYTDWLLPGDRAARDIPPGTGAVVRRGLRKIAVYVDEAGVRHECSATCPHLGCVVAWNSAERSWDCPCHGSRFDPYGRVLTGPATRDLERELPETERPQRPNV